MIKHILKTILALISVSTFVYAESLLSINITNGNVYKYCIEDDYYYSNNRLNFKRADLNGANSYMETNNPNIESHTIINNYIYDSNTNECIIDDTTPPSNYDITLDSSLVLTHENLLALNLNENDLNFMFALSGLLTSGLFLFALFRWI